MLYRSNDGYPDGHGAELVRYLKGKKLINGIGFGQRGDSMLFNGIWELGTRLIAAINEGQDSPGVRLTLTTATETDRSYAYTIYVKDGEGGFFNKPENSRIFLRCEVGYKTSKLLFDCAVDDLDPENMDKYEPEED